MMVSARRFRSISWIALLLFCGAGVMVLAFRVNALRSQVHRTEQQIISLRKEKLYLETEVETSANQQQLKLWNDVEFGYVAPSASQYLSSERQLAAFAKPDEPDAPAPIRVASADNAVAAEAVFPAIASRLTGEADLSAPAARAGDSSSAATAPADHAAATEALGARLATVGPVKQTAAGKNDKGNTDKGRAALAQSGTASGKSGRSAQPGSKPKLASAAKPAKPAKPGKTTP